MPLFDFHCKNCDRSFEVLVRGSVTLACPECGSAEVEKLVSRPAAPGKATGILARGRAQAAREGHFSNYAPAERPRRK
jgi:putative FmdB family regulatory protein